MSAEAVDATSHRHGSSSIWPDWLPRPPDSTALAFVEESPQLQPLPSSLPELLLIVPAGVPSPGMVAEALTSVGLVVQPIPLDDCEESPD